jgi:large subunit ribosomal protein L9
MKVIFMEDVFKVAKAGETKEVADGYGRNFLIPQKLALPVSPAAVNMVAVQRRKQVQAGSELAEMANHLEGQEIILRARAGAKERLHGSITNADIATALQNSTGVVVDKRKIELAEPIHQLGSYDIGIRLAQDIMPKIKVVVAGEDADDEIKAEKGKAKKKEEKAEKETRTD